MKTKKIYKRLVGVDGPVRPSKREHGSMPFCAGAERPFKKSAASYGRKANSCAVPAQK